ncbi:Cof-type HAD-IIB family hydrolase [Paenibacillus sp. J2TS4]|uniref:Cof-type HAD-IIB family hydrolase n=1 Tax=Paenibacillus sp. J2TS4 TaxID=2807194 RepID=UPI001AFD5DF6|nr:Cof-type HAD-IIB family hydrolase [Paenibacillus sp. J2TS4]GIP33921.1 sugar phosphate phosphatase [Paenibacillus sp. J2TS4]
MNYKLIALDVDGTLLNDQHELTPRTAELLREIHHAGAEIVLCTGRSPTNAAPYLKEMGLDGIMVTHNGAATVSSREMTVLHQHSFKVQDIIPYILFCRENEIHFDLSTAFELYLEHVTEWERKMYASFKMDPIVFEDLLGFQDPIVKFTIYSEKEKVDRVEGQWGDWTSSLRMIRSHLNFIDMMHPEASKGNALQKLAQSRGVSRKEILAIGNYYNDTDMIEYAGMGIAMDNSPLEVKQAADEVTASNNEEGVYQALRKHLF